MRVTITNRQFTDLYDVELIADEDDSVARFSVKNSELEQLAYLLLSLRMAESQQVNITADFSGEPPRRRDY